MLFRSENDAKRAVILCHRLSSRNTENGVIIKRIESMRAVVCNVVSLRLQMFNDAILEFESSVIATYMNSHGVTLSKKKRNRWHFCQRFPLSKEVYMKEITRIG